MLATASDIVELPVDTTPMNGTHRIEYEQMSNIIEFIEPSEGSKKGNESTQTIFIPEDLFRIRFSGGYFMNRLLLIFRTIALALFTNS